MVMTSRALATATFKATVKIKEGDALNRYGAAAAAFGDFYGFALHDAEIGELVAVGHQGDFTGIVGAGAVTKGDKLTAASGVLIAAGVNPASCIALETKAPNEKVLVNIIKNL